MNKVIFHCAEDFTPPLIYTEKNVEVYIDTCPKVPIPEGITRIIILEEPKKGRVYRYVRSNKHRYNYLLTFHEELLSKIRHSRKFLMMQIWIRDYVPIEKKFSVSTVVGGKKSSNMEGYALRHQVWFNKNKICVPKEFYLSGNAPNFHTFVPWTDVDYRNQKVLGDTKKPLFDSMFHIAIENTSIKNYFSEKLLDCFQTKTVPIYYGCTNISEYFNMRGVFHAKSLRDIINVCNTLTPELYKKMLPAIEDNYHRSMMWLDKTDQVKKAVEEVIR